MFLETYRHIIHPTQGKDYWPKSDESPMIQSEPVNKKRGRKIMLRKREAGEEVRFIKGKVARKGFKITCSICGVVGHNKRFHGSQVFSAV